MYKNVVTETRLEYLEEEPYGEKIIVHVDTNWKAFKTVKSGIASGL